MTKRFVFIFRITSICDKGCEACCNGQQNVARIPFQNFQKKLKEIQHFIESEKILPTVGFTGGEPFFYYDPSRKSDIYSLVEEVRKTLPSADVIIRTSGWEENAVLDNRLISLFELATNKQLNISFGFNLFQKQGKHAEERLNHMLNLLSTYQNRIIIDMIYNKLNIERTADLIEKGLAKIDFRYRGIGMNMLSEPSTPHRFVSRSPGNKKQIVINAYPAYNACQQGDSNHFFEENISCGVCNEIKLGPTQLFYMDDLSVYHCNDPFVDYSITPLKKDKFASVSEEFDYMNSRLSLLKELFSEGQLKFKTKQERCAFCTRFMMGEMNVL